MMILKTASKVRKEIFMSSKFNMKKNVMAVVLALMLVSSAVVFAWEPYSFTIALYAEDA